MSWLQCLVAELNEDELISLKNLRLIGKEKEVLAPLLKDPKQALPELITRCQQLAITETHYYKINSILIDKIFVHFVPEGEYKLIAWLRKKELYALLKNEIKAMQKLQHSSDYYLDVFRLLIDLPYKFYDDVLIKEIGSTYLKSLKNLTESDKLYIKFHLIFADCNRFAAGKNPISKFAYSESQLLLLEQEITGKGHDLALYYLYRTLCNYYKYYKRETSISLNYLQKAIQLKDTIANFFPINIHQFLRLLYADALLEFDSFQESYELYQKVFNEGIDEEMYGYYFHCEQYAIAAILLQKFEIAEKLLRQHFEHCLEKRNGIYATRGALAFAKLYLNNGEYKAAQHYIKLGIEINEKTHYLPFEIQLRALENIYFFLQKDFDFARQLAQRNTKFISNQKLGELSKNYKHFFKLISACCQSIELNRNLSSAIKHEVQLIETNFKIVYCNLIPKLLKITSMHSKKK